MFYCVSVLLWYCISVLVRKYVSVDLHGALIKAYNFWLSDSWVAMSPYYHQCCSHWVTIIALCSKGRFGETSLWHGKFISYQFFQIDCKVQNCKSSSIFSDGWCYLKLFFLGKEEKCMSPKAWAACPPQFQKNVYEQMKI